MNDAMENLVVAFVLEEIAVTFGLSSVQKGVLGSSSFLGERGDGRLVGMDGYSAGRAQGACT